MRSPKSALYFLTLVVLLLLAAICIRAARLPIRIYTSADGLGSSFVNSLMRDSRGFLWICTRDGLSRFDGAHFVTYQVGDKNAPPGIESILETHQGIYWITTTGGLYRFDPRVLPTTASDSDRPRLNAGFVSDNRFTLFEDHAGNLWGGLNNGLYRIQDDYGKRLQYVSDMATVDDPTLLRTMFYLWERLKMVVEPTGALGAAAALEGTTPLRGARVGVVLSGGNVDMTQASQWAATR